MKQALEAPSCGLHRSRFVWLAVSSLVALLLGILVLAGESDAQDEEELPF